MNKLAFVSEPFQLNDDTCVDVKADAATIVLGQVGEVWVHNLHLTPSFSRRVGAALIEAADRSEMAARGEP